MFIKYFIEKERLNSLTRQWCQIKSNFGDLTFYPDMISVLEALPSLISMLNYHERLNILSIDEDAFTEYYFSVYKDIELQEHYDLFNKEFREV